MTNLSTPFQINPALPKWLQELKQKSWDHFNATPLPQRGEEAWRFANLNRFNLESYQWTDSFNPPSTEKLEAYSHLLEQVEMKLTLADDHTIESPILTKELDSSGVIWSPLEKAFEEQADLLQKYFMRDDTELGAEKFSHFHRAFNRNGVFLYIPRGVKIEVPLTTFHYACSDKLALFPHTLVIAEEGAHVTVTDFFLSADDQIDNFICASASLYAATGATIHYQALQNWNERSDGFQLNTVSAEKDATIRTVNLNIGAGSMRHEHHSRAIGTGSNIETYSLSLTQGTQEMDQRTLQTHYAPHTKSDLLFKNVLLDDAHAIFSGLIRVEEKAQQIDAYQTNRNLLLSENAEANALPGLEIKANDVKCSHGTTTGYLDDRDIFYFLARGIPQKVAKELLIFSFFEEVLKKLKCEKVANETRILIQKKLSRELAL